MGRQTEAEGGAGRVGGREENKEKSGRKRMTSWLPKGQRPVARAAPGAWLS